MFDSVRVLARVFPEEEGHGHPVEGKGVEVVALPAYVGPSGLVRNLVPVSRTIRQAVDTSQAVIVRLPGAIGSLTARIARREGWTYGVECVGDPKEVFRYANIKHPLTFFMRHIFVRDLAWQCKNCTAVAYVTRNVLQRIYPAGPNTRTTYYSSVELTEDAFVKTPRRPSVPRGPLRIVTVSKLEQPYKGTDVLLRAVQRCVQAGVDVRLTVVGDGRRRTSLEDLGRQLAISDRVQFIGNVAAGEGVRVYLDAADLFVMPSRTEGLPRALIEAMARGLPAVGSNVGGIPELLSSDALVPAGDDRALAEYVCSVSRKPEVLAEHSARNLRVAKEYSAGELARRRRTFFQWVRDSTDPCTRG